MRPPCRNRPPSSAQVFGGHCNSHVLALCPQPTLRALSMHTCAPLLLFRIISTPFNMRTLATFTLCSLSSFSCPPREKCCPGPRCLPGAIPPVWLAPGASLPGALPPCVCQLPHRMPRAALSDTFHPQRQRDLPWEQERLSALGRRDQIPGTIAGLLFRTGWLALWRRSGGRAARGAGIWRGKKAERQILCCELSPLGSLRNSLLV